MTLLADGPGEGAALPENLDDGDVASPRSRRFTVRLANFEGPFDLLLQLIGKHELDVTEMALHKVTDDFIAHLADLGDDFDLDETTEFLVVAATLLDLKAARLVPGAEVDDEDDLALLEARDLLFARLLQYRAYKQAAQLFVELENGALRRFPRSVSIEDRYAELLPEVLLGVDAQAFAELAATVFRPRPPEEVGVDHLHAVHVSVPEHAQLLRDRLAVDRVASFADLTADCVATIEVIARFMALLELYRERSVSLEQPEPFADLTVTWTADRTDDPVAYAAALEDEAAAAEEAVRARNRRRRKKNRVDDGGDGSGAEGSAPGGSEDVGDPAADDPDGEGPGADSAADDPWVNDSDAVDSDAVDSAADDTWVDDPEYGDSDSDLVDSHSGDSGPVDSGSGGVGRPAADDGTVHGERAGTTGD
ncbi:Segregation and condensation protein A [Pseudonocardia sp. Ae168_Ps1]|nr:Segregation and condensation protein A [Pseudonocardia sp. Ae150A_Ps1]OLL77611.1 Segregation and condensation protein A [Pseudonocardia sp. Ae168_Ps1]OLL88271.1 Segregation and condensation protein A [Pseudonocardia sp. Ae263_Ps1]OLL91704.1 Segregation and condensation protein A [Pseudonocardia sp. Ae356_Ps1]